MFSYFQFLVNAHRMLLRNMICLLEFTVSSEVRNIVCAFGEYKLLQEETITSNDSLTHPQLPVQPHQLLST